MVRPEKEGARGLPDPPFSSPTHHPHPLSSPPHGFTFVERWAGGKEGGYEADKQAHIHNARTNPDL